MEQVEKDFEMEILKLKFVLGDLKCEISGLRAQNKMMEEIIAEQSKTIKNILKEHTDFLLSL